MLTIVGYLVAFVIGLFLIIYLFAGAALLFGLAAEYGFTGLAVYFGLWVVAFPLMIGVCIIAGVLGHITGEYDGPKPPPT